MEKWEIWKIYQLFLNSSKTTLCNPRVQRVNKHDIFIKTPPFLALASGNADCMYVRSGLEEASEVYSWGRWLSEILTIGTF